MVGIVFVSHSKLLAEGVKELAEQMTQGKVALEAAGGIDDEENPIGTDAMRVMAAIENVYNDNDVLVMMDMGSALMSAEMAIQFLPENIQSHVYLSAAPLVEGGIAAAVQAMIGASINEVIAEASSAIKSKQKQLNLDDEKPQENNQPSNIKEFIDFEITVPNKFGLHSRPASKLIELTQGLSVDVQVSINSSQWYNAKSLNNLSLLGAKQNDTLFFKASGQDSLILKEKIIEFADNNFGDNDIETESKKSKDINKDGIWGIPSSNGIAIGKATLLEKKEFVISNEKISNTTEEIKHFKNALQLAKNEIADNKQKSANLLSKTEMEIFNAHIHFLEDFELIEQVENNILTQSYSAAKAWFSVTTDIANRYAYSNNSYTRQRVSDVMDIQELVLKHLGLEAETNYNFTEPVILLSKNLQPSQTLKLDTNYVKGFATETGNENAHTSILARSLGIPAITGLANQFNKIPLEQQIIINGKSGEILIDSNSKKWENALADKRNLENKALKQREFAQRNVKTIDGIEIKINANISGITDAKLAQENGADGVGLFRTELYFMNQTTLPTEDEQFDLYSRICQILKGKTIVIRSLDIGGDKPISYLPIQKEENPFLGLRGIRFLLANKSIFKTQIKAILRVSNNNNVQMMFPMISKIDEWHQAKELVEICKKELKNDGIAFNEQMPCGIMVEVPAVVMCIDKFAQEVDFFSIGTNDLSQYLMAADRGNSVVNKLITTEEEAVLKAIETVVYSANKFNIPISICGELGANKNVIPNLLKYGIRSLSMNALQIPQIKEEITQMATKS